MIRRTVVPKDVRPATSRAGADEPQRTSTSLASRTLIAQDLPIVALERGSAIPTHVPLDVLARRVVVPRDMPTAPLDLRSAVPEYVTPSKLDARVVVPRDSRPVALVAATLPAGKLPELLEPDVVTTGEVNLLVKPIEERASRWRWLAGVGSLVYHMGLILFILALPRLFPYAPPGESELDIARQQLAFIYLPPSVKDVPKEPPAPSETPSPIIRIDPRVLREVAPPTEEPLPGTQERESESAQRELPEAPTPQLPAPGGGQEREPASPPREVARLETPKEQEPSSQLFLPRLSPGRALEDSVRDAAKGRGSGSAGFGDPLPPSPGGGGGQGYLGGNMEMLTPTHGVDFTNYLARVLASVRRNWYAVIPESARLGERGRVVLQFHILREGNVPYPEPMLVLTSGREPLDRAAISAIRASSPFEPLPQAFSGPFIELRFIFLYNLPLDYR